MYLGAAVLACWSMDLGLKRVRPLFYLLAGVFLYGVLMEILQRTMHHGRNFEFRDMIANLTGAVAGILIYRFLERKRIELAGKSENA